MTVEERAELVADLADMRADLDRNSHYSVANGRESVRANRERIHLVLVREIGRCERLLEETA